MPTREGDQHLATLVWQQLNLTTLRQQKFSHLSPRQLDLAAIAERHWLNLLDNFFLKKIDFIIQSKLKDRVVKSITL